MEEAQLILWLPQLGRSYPLLGNYSKRSSLAFCIVALKWGGEELYSWISISTGEICSQTPPSLMDNGIHRLGPSEDLWRQPEGISGHIQPAAWIQNQQWLKSMASKPADKEGRAVHRA